MPRKRKTATPTTPSDTTTTMTMEPPIEQAPEPIAVEPQIEAPLPVPVEPQTNFVERLGERNIRPSLPDPFVVASDNIAGVRLFESRRGQFMAIAFIDRPSQQVIDLLKDAGFRWNPEDRVWTHAVRQEFAMGTRIDAERLYQQVRQMIRQDKGTGQDIPF